MTMEDVYVTNVFKCLLSENMMSKDILPKDIEYRSCADVLKNQVIAAAPRKIISFGYKTLEYMLPDVAIGKDLDTLVLTEQMYENIPVMISYHPGRIHTMKRAESQKYLMTLRKFIKS
jgi:uracil-DNA glycosylase family 4